MRNTCGSWWLALVLLATGCENQQKSAPAASNTLPGSAASQAPVFDLGETPPPVEAARDGRIRVVGTDKIVMLEFATNTPGLALLAINLPTGALARTVLALVNVKDVNASRQSRILMYGNTARGGSTFSFGVSHASKFYFWGYGYDTSDTKVVPEGDWVALSVTFEKTNIVLYVNGVPVARNTVILDTAVSSLTLGDKLVGTIAGAKVWARALSPAEVAKESTLSMKWLRHQLQLH